MMLSDSFGTFHLTISKHLASTKTDLMQHINIGHHRSHFALTRSVNKADTLIATIGQYISEPVYFAQDLFWNILQEWQCNNRREIDKVMQR